MVEDEAVLLDLMTGFEFEEFFAHLLEKLHYGQVERVLFTQDEGRDILVRSAQGLVVVECKHHPNSSIGRPVVQKLHSAVSTSGAVKGILVTTGHFTSEALDYVRKLEARGTVIDMIDRPILMDMAARAGIKLVSHGQTLNVWTYAIPSPEITVRATAEYVASVAEAHPRPPASMISHNRRTLGLSPAYAVTYDIHAVFETTVGLVHEERAVAALIAFDGTTGQLLDPGVLQFLGPEPQTPFSRAPEEFQGSLPVFRVDGTTMKHLAVDAIIRRHTRIVPYRGRNNQSYSKECVPGERSIFVRDIRQMYLPFLRLDFRILQTPYALNAVQAPSGRLWPRSADLRWCRVCSKSVQGRALLCDACGRIVHQAGWLLSRIHGFRCRKCQRTTCRIHGFWMRRALLFKSMLCPNCASSSLKEGRAVRELGELPKRA